MTATFSLFKVSLMDIKPEIWRIFEVPPDISLDRFHDVVQIVMGWTDSHLHQFTIGKKRYTEYPEEPEDGLLDGKKRINNLVKTKGTKFQYLYDFGDSWDHEIEYLGKSKRSDWELIHAGLVKCVSGERACPPEDVGSIDGYYEFCKSMTNKKHPEHKENIEWFGRFYDADEFDINKVNYELLTYERWSRDRYLPWIK